MRQEALEEQKEEEAEAQIVDVAVNKEKMPQGKISRKREKY